MLPYIGGGITFFQKGMHRIMPRIISGNGAGIPRIPG